MEIEIVANLDNLYDAFKKASNSSKWKESVQKYDMDLLLNLVHTKDKLLNGSYKQLKFYEFTLNERGKTRRIKSLHISDRVVQRAFCDYVLTPNLSKYLIYDNGASVKGKGISFTRNRLKTHLEKYIRKYGTDGYILQIDFRKFFDNIPHDKLFESIKPHIDESSCELLQKMLKSFEIDVSYMTDEEYAVCMDDVYDSLKSVKCTDGLKFMRKSVGIGSQISQVIGIYYPTPIDNYCKIVRQHKYYDRYNDDICIIHQSKEYLEETLNGIRNIADELGIHINEKKTHITKLTHGFTFLKVRYIILENGTIISKLSRDSITRERRRLKKYKIMVDNNIATKEEVRNWYKSYRGSTKEYNCYNSIKNLDELYNTLFEEEI